MDKQTESEINGLYQEALKSVSSMAAKLEVLPPHAITRFKNDEGQLLGAQPEISADEAIAELYGAMKQLKEENDLVAFALITDVTMKHPTTGATFDAVRVAIEHCSGLALGIMVPYEKGESGRQFSQPKRINVQSEVFAQSQ